MDFAIIILTTTLINASTKDFVVSVKPIGIVGSQLECDKLAKSLQYTLPESQTVVCVKIAR